MRRLKRYVLVNSTTGAYFSEQNRLMNLAKVSIWQKMKKMHLLESSGDGSDSSSLDIVNEKLSRCQKWKKNKQFFALDVFQV